MRSLSVTRVLILFLIGLCRKSVEGESILEESANAHCGNIFTDKHFVLTSENYPLSYPPDKECFYLLKGDNCTTHFNIEFLEFNLISSVGCVKDRLEIGNQDALCGNKNGSRRYISENGTLKLKFVSDSDPGKSYRGFRLLVTREDACEPDNSTIEDVFTVENRNIAEDTTEPIQFEWTTKTISLKPRPSYLPPASPSCCQNNIFSSKTFLLVSPNFPYSSNSPTDCTYIIKRANSLVCRLRINVLYFSMGPPTKSSCPFGHLEIDGKYICGCNSDLQLTTDFQDSESKVLKFHSAGYNRNDASGFVLEVIQDECQKRYSPEAERSTGMFRFYKDQFNRITWPINSNINQLKLINERSYYLPPNVDRQFKDVYKHFYFFAPEDEEDVSWAQNNQEREETNIIELSTINTLLTNLYNYQQCIDWNSRQLILLQKRFGDSLKQVCKSSQQTANDETSCVTLNNLSGSFASPGYPALYPANKNVCYRFSMLPGYCAVQIYFKDFQVERSYDCLKDYLAINQYRYCGTYLTDKQVTINAEGKSHQDLNFVSDGIYCGKGFLAVYQQVRCQTPDDNSITTSNCNPEGKSADETPISCGKVISDKFFILRSQQGANLCTYDITKYAENVCKIQLDFERFNVPCEVASVTINGRLFCGEKSGHSLTIDIQHSLTIIYRQNSKYRLTPDTFVIRGEQIDTDCETFIPEAARLSSALPKEDLIGAKRTTIGKSNLSYPDVCAILKDNKSTKNLLSKVCEILIKNHNATECNFSKVVVLDDLNSTTNSTKIRLFNKDYEKVSYQEIECRLM